MIQPKVRINKKKKEAQREKIVMCFIYLIIAFAMIVLFFTAKSFFLHSKINTQTILQSDTPIHSMSRISLTSYDRELARDMMDKDGDGRCDVCGMSVEVCIDSGQLQCNMDSKSTIGVLESQHIHSDWKVYINGKPFDFSDKAHMDRMRYNLPVSSFIHVDSGNPPPENTGDILHMHATGVPLWIFFESIGLELPSKMKAYVNGKEISDYRDYVFEDSDKILITDGNGDLQKQLNSITDYAKNH